MSFTYTNTTAATDTVSRTDMDMATNYGKVIDEPTMARVSNRTASLEQPEIITYRCDQIDKISSSIKLVHPSTVPGGIQYTVKIEEVNRTTDAAGNIVDEPFAAWLTIKHSSSNTWTNAVVAGLIGRLLGACKSGDGVTAEWRFEDLMRSALMPYTD